jgi:hypothetical protein
MNLDAALADRRQCVRDSGREWLQAKWIDENAFKRIEELYLDDRVRVGLAFRILFFILTFAAAMGLMAAFYSLTIDSTLSVTVLAFFAGIACWLITGYLAGPKKRRQGGIEAAFSLAAILNLAVGIALILFEHYRIHIDLGLLLFLFLIAMVCFAAAWIWGYWPYAALSAALLFVAILSPKDGRFLCIVVAGALYPWLLKRSDSAQLPPSLRKCTTAFLAVAILALYAAINVYLLDQNAFSGFFFPLQPRESFPRWLAIILTAAVPVLIWITGILQRRRLFLLLGFGLTVLSLVTLRMYVHVAPPWLVLAGSGVLLLAVTSIIRRFLDSGLNGERAGFTAASLAEPEGKHRGLQILASVATMTPSAAPATEDTQFHGEGGKFGGGGASGNF